MASVRLAYLKLIRPNQSTFSPGTAVTTEFAAQGVAFNPLGAAGTTAPSTVVHNSSNGNRYYCNTPFSAVHAQMTALTSDSGQILLV